MSLEIFEVLENPVFKEIKKPSFEMRENPILIVRSEIQKLSQCLENSRNM